MTFLWGKKAYILGGKIPLFCNYFLPNYFSVFVVLEKARCLCKAGTLGNLLCRHYNYTKGAPKMPVSHYLDKYSYS